MTDLLDGPPYVSYLYSYPHKTAYRPLDPPRALEEIWSNADTHALYMYLHIPFCEMRCGFCNLFTQARPKDALVEEYLDALERQIEVLEPIFSDAAFARAAIGGGTPTYLTARQLERTLSLMERLGADLRHIPASIETSPETAIPERLQVLRDHGVDRISIGVQSFDDDEVKAIARPQNVAQVDTALSRIRTADFDTLNVDLMYGLPGQSTSSWLFSIRHALRFEPEEVYLYPLYVRPLTALGRRGLETWDQQRVEHYREGRSMLLSLGYEQVSMRMFRKKTENVDWGPTYRCQEDGMVGLGVGARSYTESLHYSSEYAVGVRGVREIIQSFCERAAGDFAFAEYGFELDAEEQRRRYVILSLLESGLEIDAYRRHFESDPMEDLPQLSDLLPRGLAQVSAGRIYLTDLGLERSDNIGPWLHSSQVKSLMEQYELR